MRLRETSLCHHASHKVIYSRERTQLSEPILYFTYLFFFTHVPIAYAQVNARYK